MKNLFGIVVFILGGSSAAAAELGNSLEQVIVEKGHPPGTMGANGFVILAYPDSTIWLQNNKVVRLSGPPQRASVVPAPKLKPKPKPVPIWTDDVDTAISDAREKNRLVLLFLTGAGGAPSSQRFEAEVLATTEFVDYAKDHLVLVKLDFPSAAPSKGSSSTPTPTPSVAATVNPAPETSALANPASAGAVAKTATPPLPTETKSSVTDPFPVVFILDSEGRPLGSFAYNANGPLPFIDTLKKLGNQSAVSPATTPTPSATPTPSGNY